MALVQDNDDDIIHLRNDPATALRLENARLNSMMSLLCDTSTVFNAPLFRRCFGVAFSMSSIHGLSHPGIRTTRCPLTLKFVWPQSPRMCPSRDPPHHIISGTGMLMLSGPYHHLKDSSISSPSYADSCGGRKPLHHVGDLPCTHTGSRFGTPEHMSSDRGSQFIFSFWSQFSVLLGIELHHTTSYHPQANGMVEQFHIYIKADIRTAAASIN